MKRKRLLATTLAALMVLSVLAPLGAATEETNGEDDDLSVEVDEEAYEVEVTLNDSPVENATVDVTPVDENASYAGDNESFTTEADGTVDLPEPEETVTVNVTTSYENTSGEKLTDATEATLEPAPAELEIDVTQNGDVVVTVTDNETAVSNATVDVSTVDEDASYTDEGTYTTDENGTVSLDAPFGNESVEVAFNATVDDESVETTATLEAAEYDTFGSLVSAFVENAQDDTDRPLGLAVSNFVLGHNPGNAPDHAGPPAHAGPSDDGESDQGPPAHAGPPGDDDADDADATDDDDEEGEADEMETDDDDNAGSPPEHAGSPH
ncbi:hypothetical protein RBH26_15230 [Natronolimnohabitans sp. A-GB9]|uniref:hypothetical protein n=1 Tax=Natronolimnohabitans sp. A-GB9 TaxID=3069757 RepID=UPI0027B5CA8F|nr:hypothetical protein [Natronolimnohabitans sp. A-GB9]MDQ2051830.1 hypothetical protein [Natronolimnohabitans sp. A-GB9]